MKKFSMEELMVFAQILEQEIAQIDNSLSQMEANSRKPAKRLPYQNKKKRRKIVKKMLKKINKVLDKNFEILPA